MPPGSRQAVSFEFTQDTPSKGVRFAFGVPRGWDFPPNLALLEVALKWALYSGNGGLRAFLWNYSANGGFGVVAFVIGLGVLGLEMRRQRRSEAAAEPLGVG